MQADKIALQTLYQELQRDNEAQETSLESLREALATLQVSCHASPCDDMCDSNPIEVVTASLGHWSGA